MDTRRENQEVILHGVLRQLDQSVLRIDAVHFRHHHFDISLPAEDGTKGS
jgi:hypothetical protein